MRRPVIIANWKMNKTHKDALEFIKTVSNEVPPFEEVESGVCCQAIYLLDLIKNAGENLKIGSQNMHYEDEGAYTGEISPVILKEAGVYYSLIGHSERRHYFGETNSQVNKKVKAAIKHGLVPVVCVGETLGEKKLGLEYKVIESEIEEALKGVEPKDAINIIIAYEPFWAVNTGHSATLETAEASTSFARQVIRKLYNNDVAEGIRILYGGSVTLDNFKNYLDLPDVDGALICRAALEPDSFLQMVKIAMNGNK